MRLIQGDYSETNDAAHLVFSWRSDDPRPGWESMGGGTGELRLHAYLSAAELRALLAVLASLVSETNMALENK